MTEQPPTTPAELLRGASAGDASAAKQLQALIWDELRSLAGALMREERGNHTLQATALVHEAYLRLMDSDALAAGERERFLALAARTMRRVLIDHARRRGRLRRGGPDQRRVELDPDRLVGEGPALDLLELDEALERLQLAEPRAAQVVELRFFGGLTVAETASILGVSDRTVDSIWYTARAWLSRELRQGQDP